MAEAAHPDFETRFCKPMNQLGISEDFNSYIFGQFFGKTAKGSDALERCPTSRTFPEAFDDPDFGIMSDSFGGFKDPLPNWDGVTIPVPDPEPSIDGYRALYYDEVGQLSYPPPNTTLWLPATIRRDYPTSPGKITITFNVFGLFAVSAGRSLSFFDILDDKPCDATLMHGAYFEGDELKPTDCDESHYKKITGTPDTEIDTYLLEPPLFKMGEHEIPRFRSFPIIYNSEGSIDCYYEKNEDWNNPEAEEPVKFVPAWSKDDTGKWLPDADVKSLYRDKYRNFFDFLRMTDEELAETDPAPTTEDLWTHYMLTHKAQCPHDAILGVAESIQNSRHDIVFRFGPIGNPHFDFTNDLGSNVLVKWNCYQDYFYDGADKLEVTITKYQQYIPGEGWPLDEGRESFNELELENYAATAPIKWYHEVFEEYTESAPDEGTITLETYYAKAYIKCGMHPGIIAFQDRPAALARILQGIVEIHTPGRTYDAQGFWWRAEPPGTYPA